MTLKMLSNGIDGWMRTVLSDELLFVILAWFNSRFSQLGFHENLFDEPNV